MTFITITVSIINVILLLSLYFLLNCHITFTEFPTVYRVYCIYLQRASLGSPLDVSPGCHPNFFFSLLSVPPCKPALQKGLLWPQSPSCVRGYLQSAYSRELAERLAAAPAHCRQSS